MFAKTSLVLTLILSLLFVMQAQPVTLPAEMKPGGACAGVQCRQGCCADTACCALSEQQKAPPTSTPAQGSDHLQLATIGLRVATILFHPPAPRPSFVPRNEAGAVHTLSPLAMGCIRLI